MDDGHLFLQKDDENIGHREGFQPLRLGGTPSPYLVGGHTGPPLQSLRLCVFARDI